MHFACTQKNNFYTFNRPSNRRKCNGLEKTLTNLFKGCHIINGRDIVRITIKACVTCRLAMEKSIPLQAGKVPRPFVSSTRQHHLACWIDLVTNIKLLSFEGARQTRNSSTIHHCILIQICMLTTNTSFCLLSNRRMDSMALGLKVLANRNGTPRIYYSDRESGIMALAKRGEWLVHQNGLTSKEGLTVKYCPAPGHAQCAR